MVEDEQRLARAVELGLEAEGFDVDVVHGGLTGLARATGHCYDVSILDIMLPGPNGYRVCSRLRAAGSDAGILVLTAKDGEWDAAGLGLAIARDIATLHGGTLRIEAAGAGATFRTRLPGTAPSPGGR
ncbi:response regulator [Kitasatospora griseola]|uniref:response regulator n=1 Tax=Kitasatospora griseola TaxID=2064 RepID=UPI0019BC6C1F|nr:hypothetical protein GCM10010195_23600 [Kitasatospora griseola]